MTIQTDEDHNHDVRIVQDWLLYSCPKVIETPPQTLNLNTNQNVWNQLKVYTRQDKTIYKFKNSIKRRMIAGTPHRKQKGGSY